MKKAIVALVLVVLLLPGCSGVLVNAEYSQLIDRTAVLMNESAVRAEAGKLTPEEMAKHLRYSADAWQKIRDARDGVESK
jgi:hypothetical protein